VRAGSKNKEVEREKKRRALPHVDQTLTSKHSHR
jgi:hypothetical protein